MKNTIIGEIATAIHNKGPWAFAPLCRNTNSFSHPLPQDDELCELVTRKKQIPPQSAYGDSCMSRRVSYYIDNKGLKELLLDEFKRLDVVSDNGLHIDRDMLKDVLLNEFVNFNTRVTEVKSNMFAGYEDLFIDNDAETYGSIFDSIVGRIDYPSKTQLSPEAQLRHTEYKFKRCQEIAKVGSWEMDFATGISEWSEEACKIYGLDPYSNSHSLQSWMTFVHPGDQDMVMNTIRESNEKLNNASFYHRIIRKDGSVRHIHSQTEFLLDSDGRRTHLFGFIHDVTSERETQTAFHQSEANLRMMADIVPNAIFAKDLQGNFLFVNKTLADIYGTTPDCLINRSILDTAPGKTQGKEMMEEDREVIRSGKSKFIPMKEFTNFKGEKRIYELLKVPFTIPLSNENAVLGVALDVTERVQEEKERAEMIEKIISRNKDLERFSQMVSHSLRAPVASIMGLTDLVINENVNLHEEKELMTYMMLAVKQMDTVVYELNDILSVKDPSQELANKN